MDVIVEEMTVRQMITEELFQLKGLTDTVQTNYLSYLALTKEFIPFFTAKKEPTSFIL